MTAIILSVMDFEEVNQLTERKENNKYTIIFGARRQITGHFDNFRLQIILVVTVGIEE